jgi:glycosyltransferase involved in cell wall biosynthesis
MVMLEALQLHKPLIAFRTETAQEVLMEGTALLVPTGNALELGNAIIKVATDTELKEKLSNIAIDNVFGWDKIVNQYINVYSESGQLVK